MAAAEVLMTNGSAPATPAAGKNKFFFNTAKNLAQINDAGTTIDLVLGRATAQSSPGNPTGNTSATAVMMGLAGSITPTSSGKIHFAISGNLTNNTNADGATAQLAYGTGSAPANAAAITGTSLGGVATVTNVTTANQKYPFEVHAIVTGLTLGVAYWFDLMVARITGGTGAVTDLSVTAFEL